MKIRLLLTSALFLGCSSLVQAQLAGAGKALDYNSSTVVVPNSASLNSPNITVEAWIKADTWQAQSWQGSIISKEGWAAGENGFCLRAGANGTLSFILGNFGWHEVTSTALMSANQWHHVAGTFDGTTLRVFINGTMVNSLSWTGTIATTTYDLTFGQTSYASGGGNRFFDGTIDEARIWNVALTEAQIREYMCKKVTPSHPQYANLSGYWNFDQTGNALDQSPNGNNVTTITGATSINSAAPIGVESKHQYNSAATLSIANGTMDSLVVTPTSALPFMHLYRVDGVSIVNVGQGSIDSLDQSHYYGVFVPNVPTSAYQAVYHYGTNPFASGAAEQFTTIASRQTSTSIPWLASFAPQNTTLNTITLSTSARRDLILAVACPSVNITPTAAQSFCAGGNVVLNTSTNTQNPQWNDANGPIPGATGTTLTVSTSGTYFLTGNSGVCARSSSNVVVTVNPLPIVDFGTLATTFCSNAPNATIIGGIPATGATYSGNGVTGTSFSPSTAGVGTQFLYLDFTNANGCSNRDSLQITVNAAPPTPVISQSAGSVLCTDPCNALAWSFNGTPISNATQNCYTATQNGTYSVICTSAEGCLSDAGTFLISGLGITELPWANQVELSPNPTSGIFSVLLPNLAGENLNYQLMDASGRKVGKGKFIGASLELNITSFNTGVYFLQIESSDGNVLKRIIKN